MSHTPLRKAVSKRFLETFSESDSETMDKPSPKTVKFSDHAVETSFGGTQTLAKLKGPDGQKSSSSKKKTGITPTRTSTSSLPSTLAPQGTGRGPLPTTAFLKTSRSRSSFDSATESTSQKVLTPTKKTSLPETFKTPLRRITLENRAVGTPDVLMSSRKDDLQVPATKLPRRSSLSALENSGEDSCGVTVAVRVRPFNARELADDKVRCVVKMDENETIVTQENGQVNNFTYDFSFWSFDQIQGEFASQEYIYNVLAQPLLGKALEGYNTCLFAYGQTGSGKSYSIMGHGEDIGIIPRFSEELFVRMQDMKEVSVNVEIGFYEIYNERIHDLLTSQTTKDMGEKRPGLKVREHPVLGPYVEGLSSHVVNSYEDIQGWINLGNKQRATAATGMNDKSSRSHSVFTIVMTQTRSDTLDGEVHEHSTTSKINLIDLAGSERQTTANTSGDRLREGANINRSLHALGKVISLLSEQSMSSKKKKTLFIPYRDSVLTWMLKESLGGNSQTAMIATISPTNYYVEETLSTLRYAKQARNIVNVVKVNEDPKARIIRELRAEIEKLRAKTGVMGEEVVDASLAEVAALKEQLVIKEKEMAEATKSWQERLKRSEEKKLEESRLLEKSGVALKIDNSMPNLVNLSEDAQLSELLLYVIKEGQTKVGRQKEKSKHDIQLQGALIADDHCTINNVESVISITPHQDAQTFVNGELITGPTILHHGDRVIMGDHYFRFNHPLEVQRGRKTATSGQIRDFEFARQELIKVQNARLQKELEEARKEAQQEMQEELAKTRKEAEKELNKQKHGYEDRLAELEKALYEQKTGKAQAERDHLMAKGVIDRLEEQKRLLESEVISNKRRQEMEEAAKQKPVEPLPMERCKILDELEKEKKKITEEVQRLVAIRQEREVPTALFTKPRVEVQSGRVDLYRVALLLREANKIAQFLKKNTVFNREDITKDGENQILVKVSNKKLSISTFWTLQKFEAKLVQMRELYQGESESAAEDVFYDPNDCWEKDTRLNSTSDSPRVLDCLNTSMRQRMSSRDSIRQSLASFSGNTSLLNTTLRSVSASSAKSSSTSSVDPLLNPPPPTTLAVIRDFISMDMEKLQDWSVVETHPDKILRDCDCLKVAVATLLEAYNKLSESEDISKDDFVKSEVACLSSIQIKSAMDRLVATSTMWFAMYQQIGSSLIQETTKRMMTLIRSLGNNMVLFLQGCEFDIDTMVQQSSAQILEVIFSICKLCGELSLATDTSLVTLTDYEERSGDLEEEPTSENKLGHDIRQVFLTGCDVFLDKTIQGGLRSLEECEINVQTLAENQNTNQQLSGDILKHVEIVAASAKILLQKGQEVQVELDSTLRESVNNKAENFYHLSYKRSQKLIANVSSLVDGVSLMVQATDALAKGSDGDLRKIQRIADLIQKSTNRLVACSSSTAESPASAMTDNQSETSDFSVLSDSQNEQMEIAAQEVKLATSALADYIQKTLKNDTSFGTPSKVKRMLPVSPEKLVRPSSSPNLQNKTAYIRKNLSLVDMNK
ncbi:kinesin-like protein KIF14 isoform X1 [Lingula anatina]|uniref:Kinesin-like protein KIF14 n=1 Tax=Lingula anatina TaxID=7574 RepID=A0A1S3JM74_LINAN|nr:kinesin-like protein KIF14 isoform X1 [Lingula anatina]XP_013411510.1 kinesin-like protein KIF14 isoform X1 [Lingula anatina]XP_013411512.1 kinesin-like protein KIF14 isoform X1 [Lingula anatina]|eukprot:XP_013411509.1 kinesin-like protein KIF14 isoform X1 [Lingula anatina]